MMKMKAIPDLRKIKITYGNQNFVYFITSRDYIFRMQNLGTRQQPVGANVVFQHSELMVK
jgi:hypothetical protein